MLIKDPFFLNFLDFPTHILIYNIDFKAKMSRRQNVGNIVLKENNYKKRKATLKGVSRQNKLNTFPLAVTTVNYISFQNYVINLGYNLLFSGYNR